MNCEKCICNKCANKKVCNEIMGDDDFCNSAKSEGIECCFDTKCTGFMEEQNDET